MAKAGGKSKRENIYKVTTTIPGTTPGSSVAEHVAYVRAKTKAGAVAVIASAIHKAEVASADDLIKLAGIAVHEAAKASG